ncbi:BZ3500_MvSof-1268-A1-R1_Chr3-2g06324 [Microbotryum saponariae]|uniref:BZ3500_MvSof-1268-A1-R1_Chr3-2g06324 protein n=1 Tax=Microbotryum saponariae TaxID=289078 RepID=A0A2X0M563_9BASI|nr:BZ3500_MvSof-1268-A1-R1_Chr3-2g06324 [Microbotryum saponariae]SDA04295.1 BZ3501_MvSof-1269-A2-R1_Chr3-2g06015 [Microbotryum saponariae]
MFPSYTNPNQTTTTIMSSATNNTTSGSIADTVSNAANYVKETVQEYTSASSKEANKQQMKDSNQSLGDRASAGLSAASDKIEESGHSAKADAHKETAKH